MKLKQNLFAFGLLLLVSTGYAAECPRIISQSPYITFSLQWLGLEQCIVGVSRYDRLDLPRTGGVMDPDKTAIDELMPDIIFTSDWTKPETLANVTPAGARAFRLQGFNTMQQIEDNLRLLGQTGGVADIEARITAFHHDWQQAIKRLDAKGKKVLLISSCSGSPYSFGKRSWLYDLFTQAGFQPVETHDKIRHLKPGNEFEEITALIDHLQPEVMFVFERTLNKQCNLVLPKTPVRIVALDGELFLHPAPILLQGLNDLYKKKASWQ